MTHRARRGRQLALAAGVAVCLSAARAEAQVWGDIDLPGGVTAAREVLGLGTETRTASAFLIDFIRTFHQFGDVDSAAIERFELYLRYVRELRGLLAVWPDGMELGKDRLARQTRDRWRTVAEHLGMRLREVKNRPVLEVDRGDDAAQRAGRHTTCNPTDRDLQVQHRSRRRGQDPRRGRSVSAPADQRRRAERR